MTNYKIVITQKAFSDIRDCVLFVNSVSRDAAKELYTEIIESIRSLETLPNAYPVIEGLTIAGKKIRKMPLHQGRYLVLYKVEAETVTIYDILDSRRENNALKI